MPFQPVNPGWYCSSKGFSQPMDIGLWLGPGDSQNHQLLHPAQGGKVLASVEVLNTPCRLFSWGRDPVRLDARLWLIEGSNWMEEEHTILCPLKLNLVLLGLVLLIDRSIERDSLSGPVVLHFRKFVFYKLGHWMVLQSPKA
ncbi:hypothetical protein ACJX0J_027986 [Zea mays]